MSRVKKPSSAKTRSRVLSALLAQGGAINPPAAAEESPLGRGEFWRRAGIDAATGRQGLADLREAELVEGDWTISPSLGLVLSLSLGTEAARGALVDSNGRLSCCFESPPLAGQLVELSRSLLLDRVAELAHAVLATGLSRMPKEELPLLGVSVAWPAALDAETKLPAPLMFRHPQWERDPVPVTLAVAQRLRLADWAGSPDAALWRSHGINDANAAAVSVAFSTTRERAAGGGGRSGILMVIRLGGGIGAGVVLLSSHRDDVPSFLDSYLVEGRGFAGEIAHLPVSSADVAELGGAVGRVAAVEPLRGCNCGREICLESVASARAVVDRARRSGLLDEATTGSAGDTDAMQSIIGRSTEDEVATVLKQTGQMIGRSLAGPVMLLNPRKICLTGSLSLLPVLDGIEDRKGDLMHVADEGQTTMTLLEGWDNKFAGVRGAGLVVHRSVIYRRFDDLERILGASKPYARDHLKRLAATIINPLKDPPTEIAGFSNADF
jgi:predicted NBD/HSP70 family sugar kinase